MFPVAVQIGPGRGRARFFQCGERTVQFVESAAHDSGVARIEQVGGQSRFRSTAATRADMNVLPGGRVLKVVLLAAETSTDCRISACRGGIPAPIG